MTCSRAGVSTGPLRRVGCKEPTGEARGEGVQAVGPVSAKALGWECAEQEMQLKLSV